MVNQEPEHMETHCRPPEVEIYISMLPSDTPCRHSAPLEQSCVPTNSSTEIAPFEADST